jgi:hypothetical protein
MAARACPSFGVDTAVEEMGDGGSGGDVTAVLRTSFGGVRASNQRSTSLSPRGAALGTAFGGVRVSPDLGPKILSKSPIALAQLKCFLPQGASENG